MSETMSAHVVEASEAAGALPAVPTRFVARQPIVSANSVLYGYELSYRVSSVDPLDDDAEQAAQQVIDNYLLLMPQMEQGKGFVRCTRDILVNGLTTLLPRRNTVLEVVGTVEADAEVLALCRSLHKMGYRFAFDDFSPAPDKEAFLDCADYLKIDYKALTQDERRKVHSMSGRSRIANKVIAKHVETAEDFETAKSEGCQLFMGSFFTKSSTVNHRTIPGNQMTCLRLMQALSQDAPDTKELERLVMSDTSLCYRLLRLVNSALYSLNSQVTSIRSALMIVGTDEFRKLVTVALAGALAESQSKSLVTMALERARFCELLAPKLKEEGPKLYLLGMLSLIDAILSVSMWQITELLPLDPDMKAALLGGQSSMGIALNLIRSYQAADWPTCEQIQQKLGLDEKGTTRIYAEAVRWADEAVRQ